jgi:hypothetical protein
MVPPLLGVNVTWQEATPTVAVAVSVHDDALNVPLPVLLASTVTVGVTAPGVCGSVTVDVHVVSPPPVPSELGEHAAAVAEVWMYTYVDSTLGDCSPTTVSPPSSVVATLSPTC